MNVYSIAHRCPTVKFTEQNGGRLRLYGARGTVLSFPDSCNPYYKDFCNHVKNIQRNPKFRATPCGAALNITRGTIYVPQDFSMYQSKAVFVKRRRQKRQQPCKNMQKIDMDYTKLFDGYRNRSKKSARRIVLLYSAAISAERSQ